MLEVFKKISGNKKHFLKNKPNIKQKNNLQRSNFGALNLHPYIEKRNNSKRMPTLRPKWISFNKKVKKVLEFLNLFDILFQYLIDVQYVKIHEINEMIKHDGKGKKIKTN